LSRAYKSLASRLSNPRVLGVFSPSVTTAREAEEGEKKPRIEEKKRRSGRSKRRKTSAAAAGASSS
jgi:hypothetical protein